MFNCCTLYLMTLSISVDRFDYCAGSYLFWSEHHEGQFSDGYARLCRLGRWFTPGMAWKGWDSLNETARDVYRAWCEREGETCTYDTVKGLLEASEAFELEDPCVEWFLDWCEGETLQESGLVNFDHSDFVNVAMPYTRDLIRFYDDNEESVLYWFDQWQECLCVGGCRLDAMASVDTTVDDADDFKTAAVNLAMSYLGGQLLRACEEAQA